LRACPWIHSKDPPRIDADERGLRTNNREILRFFAFAQNDLNCLLCLIRGFPRQSAVARLHCKLESMDDAVVARRVFESQSERSEIIFPADANALGNLFGGRLMQFIDLVGAMAASRHARAFTITASMDHLDFVAPVHVGDLLILKASVNRAFKTSMEVGVKAMVEDVRKQELRHVSSAYLTYVAVDRDGKPIVVPQLVCETDHQRRRWEDAGRRREMRSGETLRKKRIREEIGGVWNV